ncbi:Replication protein 14 [Enterobacter sp. EGD-HP1]|nr:Replication protein 14 [Enterobacter sp. EGD-HP1]
MERVDAGMRMVRRQERPFLPSPGQFIKWCREGRCALGITTSDVMAEYWKWRKLVFRYPSSEQYPWPKPIFYHICIELRRRGTDGQLCQKELEHEAGEILAMWEKRVLAGKPIPPIRRALAAPVSPKGLTPAELLKAKYQRMKADGRA